MADADDAAVDRVIERIQEALSDLKSSQAKDEADEGEQPKDLKTAAIRVREHFRRRREQANQ